MILMMGTPRVVPGHPEITWFFSKKQALSRQGSCNLRTKILSLGLGRGLLVKGQWAAQENLCAASFVQSIQSWLLTFSNLEPQL